MITKMCFIGGISVILGIYPICFSYDYQDVLHWGHICYLGHISHMFSVKRHQCLHTSQKMADGCKHYCGDPAK